MSELVTLTTVRFSHEAQLIESCLRAEGIPCLLAGEYVASLIGRADWGNPLGGIRIQVIEQDLVAAQEILQSAADQSDEAAQPARRPWHGIITEGLRRVPIPFRIPLLIYGALIFLVITIALAWSLMDSATNVFLKP